MPSTDTSTAAVDSVAIAATTTATVGTGSPGDGSPPGCCPCSPRPNYSTPRPGGVPPPPRQEPSASNPCDSAATWSC